MKIKIKNRAMARKQTHGQYTTQTIQVPLQALGRCQKNPLS
jgi:hypothetical protein